jgi:hypothetical protein
MVVLILKLELLLKPISTNLLDLMELLVVSIPLILQRTWDLLPLVQEINSSDMKELLSLMQETLFNSTTLMAHSGDNSKLKTQEVLRMQALGSICTKTGLFLLMPKAQPLTITQ